MTKARSKAARRAARKAESAAVAAQIWEDREGKARPTPERLSKGAFVLRDTEDAGVTVAVDEAATMLDRLGRAGVITPEQVQAGHDLAALLERTRLVSGGRSCCDFSPVGHEGNAEPTHGELRDHRERAELHERCGHAVWADLRRVCHEGQRPHSPMRLSEGLTICARFWGLI